MSIRSRTLRERYKGMGRRRVGILDKIGEQH